MRRYMAVTAGTAAAATLTGLASVGGAPVGGAVPGMRAAPGTRAAPGAQLWVARSYRGGEAWAMAVDPGGRMVFVTGDRWSGQGTGRDYATTAYDAATGRRLWVSRYNGPRTAMIRPHRWS